MARPKAPSQMVASQVSGNRVNLSSVLPGGISSMAGSAAIYKQKQRRNPKTDRNSLAQPWQYEVYRHLNICGEARYAATLFASLAARAEIGVSEPQTLARKAVWVKDGEEVDTFAEIVPTVRDRSRLIRDYMLHRITAGECYLIARDRVDTDPGYIDPPEDFTDWDTYLRVVNSGLDLLDPDVEPLEVDPNPPIWEIVAVTEIEHTGDGKWRVRHENGEMVALNEEDPVIRMWNPDPQNRMEAWSPFRSMINTLREIEWLTGHIFTQVRSRLMSAGVWFLPDNLTFPAPPPDSMEGGEEAIAALNEAEQFMLSLAASGTYELDMDEVSFPTVVMADPAALEAIDKDKLIQFWSEIDEAAMRMRSASVQRFAIGMDLPPEQVLGSSGLAVAGSSGSAGSVNHWGEWAKEEQTIKAHIEPALDDFVSTLTVGVLRVAHPDTDKVIGYDTASLRMRQDRSKESIELFDRGQLKGEVMLRENGFDPEQDMMTDEDFKRWVLIKMLGGSPTPEQVATAVEALTGLFMPAVSGNEGEQKGLPGPAQPRNLDDHPYEGPPREQHDHSPAPFSVLHASCEAMTLRALEKAGNVLLNSGKRGRDKDRTTPAHMAHVAAGGQTAPEFDFTMLPMVLADLPAVEQARVGVALSRYCTDLYDKGEGYSREGLIEALG